jgi:hypothetical protein
MEGWIWTGTTNNGIAGSGKADTFYLATVEAEIWLNHEFHRSTTVVDATVRYQRADTVPTEPSNR